MLWDDVATKQDLETLHLGILADLCSEMLQMTHKLYFGMAGIVFTAVSLSFVAARVGGLTLSPRAPSWWGSRGRPTARPRR